MAARERGPIDNNANVEYKNITAKFEFTPSGKNPQSTIVKAERELTIDHVENFLDCVRTRKRPNGDVYIGHRSAQASHLGNIAYLQKRRLKFDPAREEILPL